jgi:hypothetical protein
LLIKAPLGFGGPVRLAGPNEGADTNREMHAARRKQGPRVVRHAPWSAGLFRVSVADLDGHSLLGKHGGEFEVAAKGFDVLA